jgi:hypothetical protein
MMDETGKVYGSFVPGEPLPPSPVFQRVLADTRKGQGFAGRFPERVSAVPLKKRRRAEDVEPNAKVIKDQGKQILKSLKMLMKGIKMKVMVIFSVLLMFVMACIRKHEDVFDISDVKYVEISKVPPFILTDSTVIYDRDTIKKLFGDYLNNSSQQFGKVANNYRLRILRNNGVVDTVFLDGNMYVTKRTGTRRMKKDATSFIEQLFRK